MCVWSYSTMIPIKKHRAISLANRVLLNDEERRSIDHQAVPRHGVLGQSGHHARPTAGDLRDISLAAAEWASSELQGRHRKEPVDWLCRRPWRKHHRPLRAFLYNDDAGRRTLSMFIEAGFQVEDMSVHYQGCKDLNEFHVSRIRRLQEQAPITTKPSHTIKQKRR